jgi:hypothetical protein
MTLITLIVTLAVVGLLLYLVNNYIPMAGPIKGILNIVVIIGVSVWLLQGLGIIGPIDDMRVSDIRIGR